MDYSSPIITRVANVCISILYLLVTQTIVNCFNECINRYESLVWQYECFIRNDRH